MLKSSGPWRARQGLFLFLIPPMDRVRMNLKSAHFVGTAVAIPAEAEW
jgi:hypothetical protein